MSKEIWAGNKDIPMTKKVWAGNKDIPMFLESEIHEPSSSSVPPVGRSNREKYYESSEIPIGPVGFREYSDQGEYDYRPRYGDHLMELREDTGPGEPSSGPILSKTAPSRKQTIRRLRERRLRIETEDPPEETRSVRQKTSSYVPPRFIEEIQEPFKEIHIREAYPSSFIRKAPAYGVVASRYERYKSFKQQHKKSWKQRMIWRLPPWHPSAKRYFSKQSKKVYREPVYYGGNRILDHLGRWQTLSSIPEIRRTQLDNMRLKGSRGTYDPM